MHSFMVCAVLGRIWNTSNVKRPTIGDALDCGWTWCVKLCEPPQHAHTPFVVSVLTLHPWAVMQITLDNPAVMHSPLGNSRGGTYSKHFSERRLVKMTFFPAGMCWKWDKQVIQAKGREILTCSRYYCANKIIIDDKDSSKKQNMHPLCVLTDYSPMRNPQSLYHTERLVWPPDKDKYFVPQQ